VAVRPPSPDWKALAPVWHCFETGGLSMATLRAVRPSVTAPLLYVGGGRGVFPSRLQRWLAPGRIAVVDYCLAMARRGQREFGLTYACSDIRALSFAPVTFASALCTTGVLEYLDDADRVAALRELRRVTGGPVLVTAFDDAGPADHSALELWWNDSEQAGPRQGNALSFDAVARTVGGREAAFHLLRRALPSGGRPMGAEELVRVCAAAGATVARLHSGAGVTVWRVSSGQDTSAKMGLE
jgi:hypothetical protein